MVTVKPKPKAKTYPLDYKKQLSEESEYSRIRTEEAINKIEEEIDLLTAAQKEQPSGANVMKLLKAKAKHRRLELSLDYQGANPKKVPVAVLKEMVNTPLHRDVIEDQARGRIKNRSTAIRAFCTYCMSGQPGLIRQCESVGCPLWPFRMGEDPFRGFDIPKLHLELDKAADDDDADAFEDGESGDETDAKV